MLSVEARLSELLSRWEDGRRQGKTISPEDLCCECPELLPDLISRIEALEAMSSVLGTEAEDDPYQPSGLPPGPLAVAGAALEDFEILGELGRGGMGVVFRARHRKNHQIVAIKCIQRFGPSALARFKQEFRAMTDLTHHNWVVFYELFSDGRDWFFTMEFVDGVNFLSHVRSEAEPGAALDPEQGLTRTQLGRLRDALRQLAQAVLALHDADRIHRDIKPTNVMVERGGRVVLLDFGLTAQLEPSGLYQSTEAHALGTAAYMPPEQAAGKAVSRAGDWYSVGVMLYEALTGRLPFHGLPLEVLAMKQSSEPRAPHDLVPEVAEDLEALCVDLLRRDPEARPSGQEVLHRLGSSTAQAARPFVSRSRRDHGASLIGRERHLETLDTAFSTMSLGRTVTVYVHGRSGVGKSALVERFLDNLAGREGAVVLSGRCYEQESMPFKAFDSLIDALAQHLRHLPVHDAQALLPRDIRSLARLFPVLGRVQAVALAPGRPNEMPDPQELRRRAFAAFRELLARIGDHGPLVIAIDDLQWGDADSVALLSALLQPPDTPVLLLLGAYRSEEATTSAFLRAIHAPQDVGNPAVDRLELAVEPLNRVESETLALRLFERDGPASRARAEAVAEDSGGNPFFVHQLVRRAQSGAGLSEDSSPAEIIPLDRIVWEQALRLPEPARRLLEVLAVAGRPARLVDLRRAAGPEAAEPSVLKVLRYERLIRSTGPREEDVIETYHDRVREAVVASLDPVTLRSHHHHLALALEASQKASSEVLAEHFLKGGECERAGAYYQTAADEAGQTLAFDRAVKLYRRALELRHEGVAEHCQLRIKLADALVNAGHCAEAAHEYLAASEDVDVSGALRLKHRASMQLLMSGHVDEGLEVLRAVLNSAGMTLPSTPTRVLYALLFQRARLRLRGLSYRERDSSFVPADVLNKIDICCSIGAGLGLIDCMRGVVFHTRGLLLALRAGEPSRIARALTSELAYSTAGGFSRRRTAKVLQATHTVAQRVDQPRATGTVWGAKGIAKYLAGMWREALASCDRADAIFREHCVGVTWELDTTHTFAMWSLMFMGEVAELSRRRPALLREAEERGDRFAVMNLGTWIMSIVRLAANDPDGAQRELNQREKEWSQQGFHLQHHNALMAQVNIDLYRGDGRAAWGHVAERRLAYAASHLLRVQHVRIFVTLSHSQSALAAAVADSNPRPLLRAAERDAFRLEREKIPWSWAFAQFIRAGVAVGRGDLPTATALLAVAADSFDAVDMRLNAAVARRRRGELLGGDQGQDLVAEANAWMMGQEIRNPDRMTAMYAPGFPG